MAGLGCKWAWLIEELLFNSSLEHMFCHTVTSRVSPTDFRFYVLEWQHDLPYGGGRRILPVLNHWAFLIESMDNQQNLLLCGRWRR